MQNCRLQSGLAENLSFDKIHEILDLDFFLKYLIEVLDWDFYLKYLIEILDQDVTLSRDSCPDGKWRTSTLKFSTSKMEVL